MKKAPIKFMTVLFTIAISMAISKTSAQYSVYGFTGNPGPGASGSGIFANGQSAAPSVPFDGGMSLVLAANGILYVSRRLRPTVR